MSEQPSGLRRFVRRHLTTTLMVIGATAGVAYYLHDRSSVTTDERDYRKHNLVDVWRDDDLSEIVLEQNGTTTRLLAQAPDDAGTRGWDVELAGKKYPAEEQVVDQLIGTLDAAIYEREVPADAVDRAAAGLDAPALRVTVVMGEISRSVVFGAEAPTPPGTRYAQVEGRGVFVVKSALLDALNLDPEKLRSRSFVPYLSIELSALSLEGEGGSRRFVRAPWSGSRGAGFRFDGSGPMGDVRVDALLFDDVLVSLGRMEAQSFLDDARADAAAKPRVTLTMTPTDGEPGVIELGGECPDAPERVIAIRRAPTRLSICVDGELLGPLLRPAEEFADKAVFGAHLDEIGEVVMSEGERSVDLARVAEGWKMRAPEERAIGAQRGREFVAALSAATGQLVRGPRDDAGLGEPRATVRLISSFPKLDGTTVERIEEVEVGAEVEGATYVRRLEDGAVLTVDKDVARRLLPSAVALRDPRVFATAVDEVSWSRIVVTLGDRVQEVTRATTGLAELVRPKLEGVGPDGDRVQALAMSTTNLEADRWVADVDDGSFGLSRPRLTVELEGTTKPDHQAVLQKVLIGASAERGAYAKVDGEPAVFVAPQEFVVGASRWLVDRRALVVPEARVTELEVRAEGDTIAARREAGVWTLTGDAAAHDDAKARAGELKDAVTDLGTVGMVDLGTAEPAFGFASPTLSITLRLEEEPAPVRIDVGAGDTFEGQSVYYVRRAGIDATFAIARAKVRRVLDAL